VTNPRYPHHLHKKDFHGRARSCRDARFCRYWNPSDRAARADRVTRTVTVVGKPHGLNFASSKHLGVPIAHTFLNGPRNSCIYARRSMMDLPTPPCCERAFAIDTPGPRRARLNINLKSSQP
jgi:hypothetical protein